ncbi:MAG TPA: hypothetical protein VLZ30_06895 [Verrucomicrobiae bacterium]|nr:hypothetical protein [Verrucomicrobiae bacterium]
MRISKQRVNRSVLAAILLGLTGGLVVAYLTYHLHIVPPDISLDAAAGSYSQ